MRKSFAATLALTLALATPAGADVVLDWNGILLDLIRDGRSNPPRASRVMALTNVAVFDAVVGVAGGYETYADHVAPTAGASLEAAAVAAAHRALLAEYPDRQAELDAALDAWVATVSPSIGVTDGIAYGRVVADDILALRAADGAGTPRAYGPPEGAGWWAPTGPAFAPALLPNWPYVTPWCLSSGGFLRRPAPPPLTGSAYAAAFDEVRRLGAADSVERSAEQAEIALFWNDGAGTNTPPGHWNEILQGVAAEQGLGTVETARLLALHAIAQADAAIVSWDNKFAFDHWRPVTGIRLAATDGNPATEADPDWASFIPTPPFPAYTSGHSTFSGSSARIAELFFGRDDLAFTASSDGLPGVTRHFPGFRAAAEEAGQSRIYGGIHWQYDNEGGLASGRALAEQVFFGFLRPLDLGPQSCDPGGALCLQDGRFAVEVAWATKDGDRGAAVPRPDTDDAGSFWFFDPANTEVTAKVLDACAGFERYWVFVSGLTDVEVLVTVTDTASGEVRQYFNPQGRPFAPVQDTAAFATCP